MHTGIQAYMYACIHTYQPRSSPSAQRARVCMHTQTHTNQHTQRTPAHMHSHVDMYICTDACLHTYTHSHVDMYAHTHTLGRTDALSLSHTHTFARALSLSLSLFFSFYFSRTLSHAGTCADVHKRTSAQAPRAVPVDTDSCPCLGCLLFLSCASPQRRYDHTLPTAATSLSDQQVETAAVAAPKVETQAEAAKSHFGGRVQVGGHTPGGLKIS